MTKSGVSDCSFFSNVAVMIVGTITNVNTTGRQVVLYFSVIYDRLTFSSKFARAKPKLRGILSL